MPQAPATGIQATAAPVTVDATARQVAQTIDAFWADQGVTPAWNASRTVATLTESTTEADVTLVFSLGRAGAGKTKLTVNVTFESGILPLLSGDDRTMLASQLEASCAQLGAVIAHLAGRAPEAKGPGVA